MAKHEALPPAVKNLIQATLDNKANIWQRENAAQMLENIVEACSQAAKHFRAEQIKINTKLAR